MTYNMTDYKDCEKLLKEKLRLSDHDGSMSLEELFWLLLSFTDAKNKKDSVINGIKARYGRLEDCFKASYSELMMCDGMTRNAALLILLTFSASIFLDGTEDVKTMEEYCEMFRFVLRSSRTEEFWCAVLDESDGLISMERLAVGSANKIDIRIRDIVKTAAFHGAKRVLVAHSHVDSEEAEFSKEDIDAMRYIGYKLEELGVRLVGQVVVAGGSSKYMPYENQALIKTKTADNMPCSSFSLM